MRFKRPILLTLFIVFLALITWLGAVCARDFLVVYYGCRLHEVAQESQKMISDQAKNYENDRFLKKYFIEPQQQRTLAQLKEFMGPFQSICKGRDASNFAKSAGPRVQMSKFLSWFFPQYHKEFSIHANGLKYILDENNSKENELIEKKRQVQEMMMGDLEKYYFFMKQVRMTQKMMAQFSSSCRTPAFVDPRKYECQRSIKKLSAALSKEEENLKFNYTILVEKWREYKEWIDQEIALFEKQNLEKIES